MKVCSTISFIPGKHFLTSGGRAGDALLGDDDAPGQDGDVPPEQDGDVPPGQDGDVPPEQDGDEQEEPSE